MSLEQKAISAAKQESWGFVLELVRYNDRFFDHNVSFNIYDFIQFK